MKPFGYLADGLLVAESIQDLPPKIWHQKPGDDAIRGPLTLAQSVEFFAKIFLRSPHLYFVDTLDALLGLAPTTWLISIALDHKNVSASVWPNRDGQSAFEDPDLCPLLAALLAGVGRDRTQGSTSFGRLGVIRGSR